MIESLRWVGDWRGHLELIDQTQLPAQVVSIRCVDSATVFEAIRQLRVRGAPAIGIAAAYGVVVECANNLDSLSDDRDQMRRVADAACDELTGSRPTAVNLFWALARMRRRIEAWREDPQQPTPAKLVEQLWHEARAIHEEDRAMCRAIGLHGAALLEDVTRILTHCNTGSLATSEYGTALSIVFTAQDQGRLWHVYVDETRPLWQGARLTTWELQQRGIPATLICDSMAAWVMRQGMVEAVITGADRIASNGDTANKIGTYGLAVLAQAHGIPFYVAAPSSTFDLSLPNGLMIPIEQRPAAEVAAPFGLPIAPADIDVFNPAFDVTPAHLIRGIVTERGVIQPVSTAEIITALGVV